MRCEHPDCDDVIHESFTKIVRNGIPSFYHVCCYIRLEGGRHEVETPSTAGTNLTLPLEGGEGAGGSNARNA